MRSILIVGAAGYLGRTLVRHCRAVGIRTVGVDSAQMAGVGGDAPDVSLSVDVASNFSALPESVDLAVFAAQGASRRALEPEVSELFRINAGGVARCLAVLASNGGVPLLHCSTGSVYRPSWSPIAESAEVREDDPYALSKLHAESMACLHLGRLQTVNLRIFGLYGPRQRHRLLPGIAGRIRRGEPVRLARGRDGAVDGGLRISLLHVDDAAAAVLELGVRLVNRESIPQVLNLASDDAPDVRQIADAVADRIGISPSFEEAPARVGDLVADTTLLSRTSRSRRRSFCEGIEQTLASDPRLGES